MKTVAIHPKALNTLANLALPAFKINQFNITPTGCLTLKTAVENKSSVTLIICMSRE